MKSIWVHRLFSVYFLGVALVQLNDPDPWLWVTIYLVAFGLSLKVGRLSTQWYAIFGLACATVALWVGMNARDWAWTLESESFREVVGMAIIVLWTRWVRHSTGVWSGFFSKP